MKIPFVDLVKQYKNIKSKIDAAIQTVLDNAEFIGGECLERFEHAFAEQHHAKYCLGTSSGTAALHLILWSLGIGPGDEVIVPVNTFVATAEAVALTGAKPVFVDCDETYNLDMNQVYGSIHRETKAIIPVHLYGQVMNIPNPEDFQVIKLVEDCCQAHNAIATPYKGLVGMYPPCQGGLGGLTNPFRKYVSNQQKEGKMVGNSGIAGAFSFYPSKNLGAFGDGGAVITNDESLYHEMRMRQNHGQFQKGKHDVPGHNYRLDSLQAAVLQVKLKYIDEWTIQRIRLSERYRDTLSDIHQVTLPNRTEHVYHLFVIRVPKRDELRSYLQANGIDTGIHYPIPLHLQKAFSHLGYKEGDFPIAEKYAKEILSLPMYPELTKEQIEYISEHIWTFYHI